MQSVRETHLGFEGIKPIMLMTGSSLRRANIPLICTVPYAGETIVILSKLQASGTLTSFRYKFLYFS